MGRYEKNGIFTSDDMNKLSESHVCVIGCGGLGGYVVEMLARAGVGKITAVDGDVFDETNLNRQILSQVDNIGKVKVQMASERIQRVNPDVTFHPVHDFLDEENAFDLVKTAHVVVDCLDRIPVRFVLQEACEKADIPLVYGAIAGWYGQVSTIYPGDRTLNKVYPDHLNKGVKQGVELDIGNPSFTPALAASLQVSECLKVLTGKGELLRGKLLYIDLLDNEMTTLPL